MKGIFGTFQSNSDLVIEFSDIFMHKNNVEEFISSIEKDSSDDLLNDSIEEFSGSCLLSISYNKGVLFEKHAEDLEKFILDKGLRVVAFYWDYKNKKLVTESKTGAIIDEIFNPDGPDKDIVWLIEDEILNHLPFF